MTTIAAYIPARSHSLRLPGKNLRLVGGVPLIVRAARVAQAARELGLIDRFVVDIEDGATERVLPDVHVRWRPSALQAPETRVIDLVRGWLREEDDQPDLVAILLPTSPLRTVRHLIESRLLLYPGADGVMSVTPFLQDVAYALQTDSGFLRRRFLDDALPRFSDDEPPVTNLVKHDGTVIWARASALLALRPEQNFYALRLLPYMVSPDESVDVNTELDLVIAEALLERRGEVLPWRGAAG